MKQRKGSENPADFTEDYKQGFKDGWDRVEEFVKEAVETYEAAIFVCRHCGKLAYMVDPGDGLVTHLE